MLPVNGNDGFIQVPGIAQLALPLFQFSCIGGLQLQASLSDAFIRDDDAAFGEEFFDFTEAQTESMVEPDGVADDGRRKPMALVADGCGVHAEQSAKPKLN